MSELSPQGGSEGYEACGDEGAPGFVEQKQLDELNIVCTNDVQLIKLLLFHEAGGALVAAGFISLASTLR